MSEDKSGSQTLGSTADSATLQLARDWAALWDGDLQHTQRIVAEDFISHAAPLLGGPHADNKGRDLLNAWVSGAHQAFDGLHFALQLGPFRDGDTVIIRWRAEGTYREGTIPGATAEQGKTVVFYGTDILRLVDGVIAEYWVNSDSLWAAQQLGMSLPPLEASN